MTEMFFVVHPSVVTSSAAQKKKKNPTSVSKYQEYEHELNKSGIQYLVGIEDIGKCQHQNNISVNVYGYEDKKISSLRITTMSVARDHVNLLCIGESLDQIGIETI